jgi:hypothetical protein
MISDCGDNCVKIYERIRRYEFILSKNGGGAL